MSLSKAVSDLAASHQALEKVVTKNEERVQAHILDQARKDAVG